MDNECIVAASISYSTAEWLHEYTEISGSVRATERGQETICLRALGSMGPHKVRYSHVFCPFCL